MLDQTGMNDLRVAVNDYYTLFNIDPANTYGYNCINQYYATGIRTIGFHSPDYINNGQEIAMLMQNPVVLNSRERTLLQTLYHGLPSVISPTVKWPEGYGLDDVGKETVGKMLSVCHIRRDQVVDNSNRLIDLEPATIPEMDWLFTRFPNAIYMAVQLGRLIPKTTLRAVDKFYLIIDPQRAAMLN